MEGLAELHTHLGGSVSSDILWSLAHEQGIALPVKDYWEFDRLVTIADPRGVADLDALDAIYHWTELIQSSPIAVERSVHAAIGGAYRSQGITTLELRFNPMKRNRGGERDRKQHDDCDDDDDDPRCAHAPSLAGSGRGETCLYA